MGMRPAERRDLKALAVLPGELAGRGSAAVLRGQCLGLWLVSGFGREEEAHRFYRRCGFEATGCRFVKRF